MASNDGQLKVDGSGDFSGGCDGSKPPTIRTATNPNGLPRNMLAWLNNATVRGGGIQQRTGWEYRQTLQAGTQLFQGGHIYMPDTGDPYLMVSIGGNILKVLLAGSYDVTDVTAGNVDPSTEPLAYFVQGEQFLVKQSGNLITKPLFWDGVSLRRSNGLTGVLATSELPPAGPMTYYMGRIWYAQGRKYTGGDIVGGASGTAPYNKNDSILKVTENPLSLGGDGFSIPSADTNIRALFVPANLNAALGQGQLFIGTRKNIYALTVPVDRKAWVLVTQTSQPLQTIANVKYGTVGDRCVVNMNGDSYYQTMEPGIRSLNLAQRFFNQWGNTPLSKNVNRVLQFNNRALMRFATGVEFDNRLWQAVLPVQTPVGVAFQAVVLLDFDLISSFQDKLDQRNSPAWEGMYEGLDILQMFTADFGGFDRMFSVVYSKKDGSIQLWEMTTDQRFENGDNRISWIIEFPSYTGDNPFKLKQLQGGELWIDKLFGKVDFQLYYRADQNPCWQFWHQWQECAARDCTEEDSPCQISYPAYPTQQFREQFRATRQFPKPPARCDYTQDRPTDWGYGFQAMLKITGWARIRGFLPYFSERDKAPYGTMVCPTT